MSDEHEGVLGLTPLRPVLYDLVRATLVRAPVPQLKVEMDA